MSTTTHLTWRHGEVFPIIARLIGEEYERHGRFIVAREIAARLLHDSEARIIIDAVYQRQQERKSEQIAVNMVAWFSQRFTIGESPYTRTFERMRIDDQWAYRPVAALSLSGS